MITELKKVDTLKLEFNFWAINTKAAFLRNNADRDDILKIETLEIFEEHCVGVIDFEKNKEWFLRKGSYELVIVLTDNKERSTSLVEYAGTIDFEFRLDKTYKVKLYKNDKGNLSLQSFVNDKVVEKKVKTNEGTVDVTFELPFKAKKGIYLMEVTFNEKEPTYEFYAEVKDSNQLTFSITIPQSSSEKPIYFSGEKPLIKLFFKIFDFEEETRQRSEIILGETNQIKKNSEGNLLTIPYEYSGYEFREVKIESDKLELHVSCNSQNGKIYVKKRNNFNNPLDGTAFVELPKKEEVFSLDFEEFRYDFNLNENRVFDFYYREDTKEQSFISPLKIAEKNFEPIKLELYNRAYSIYKSEANTLALSVIKKISGTEHNRLVKIGIIGSYYTHSAFFSADYFNPSYTEKYEVTDQITENVVASLLSDPVKIAPQELEKITDLKIREGIELEFTKKYLQMIRKKEPDFILIDFFAEIACDLLKLSEGQYIVNNAEMKKLRLLENGKIKGEMTPVETWTSRKEQFIMLLDVFIRELKRIVPEERIILNRVKLSEAYYTKDGKKQSFSEKEIDDIRILNSEYQSIEDIFIDRLPIAKIIDLKDCQFITDQRAPSNTSISQFESDYYKEFMNRFDTIVIRQLSPNKVKRKKRHGNL